MIFVDRKEQLFNDNSSFFFWNNGIMNITGRAFTIKKLLLFYSPISTSPTLWIFVTKLQRTLKKDTAFYYISHSHFIWIWYLVNRQYTATNILYYYIL